MGAGGGGTSADRKWAEHQQDLTDALEAWRVNPLARRIVQLTTDFVVGDGMAVAGRHGSERVNRFVREFWFHSQNRLDLRLAGWCDELTRAGELFVALFANPADGMQYVRTAPAAAVRAVDTDEEDLERERGYWQITEREERYWKGVGHPELKPEEPVMLHYTVNKPVGATRGEGDLGPILVWLRRAG